jgi:hypothetical protein
MLDQWHGLPARENTAKMAVPHITDTKNRIAPFSMVFIGAPE